jgi:hypothetical protein
MVNPSKNHVLIGKGRLSIVLLILVISPASVYGYATSVETFDVGWSQKNLTVCIVNNAEEEYRGLFEDAVAAWQIAWPYLSYNFKDSSGDDCNISVYIVRAYAELTSRGHAGVAEVRHTAAGISSAEILIPTEIEQEGGEIRRLSNTSFYRIAMHEFGHSIGLLHATDENYQEPVDIMAPILAQDSRKMLVSEVDVGMLNELYGVETEFVPPREEEIEPLPIPPPAGPQVLQEMRINIQRTVYYTNETLRFAVTVPAVVSGIEANVVLYHSGAREKIVLHVAPDANGSFFVDVPLQEREVGIWTVKVSYVSWVSETAFAVKAAPSNTEVPRDDTYSVKADQKEYELGETVNLSGKVSKLTGWWLEIIDPGGRKFAVFNAQSAKLKPDGTYELSFTLPSNARLVGEWGARLMQGSDSESEKSSVMFEVRPGESVGVEARVQAKQVKDLILLRLTNLEKSSEDIYGLIVRNDIGAQQACRAADGWSVEACTPDEATLLTRDSPLTPGTKTYFMLKIDKPTAISWEVHDKHRNLLANGTLMPIQL